MATVTHKLYLFGCKVSDRGANLAGHPAAIALVAIFCAIWFVRGGQGSENTLTLILSVLAITLTQMVLNQQRRSEAALHMKIDELILSQHGARDELAGIEKKTEDELEELRRGGDAPRSDCDAVLDDPPRPATDDSATPQRKAAPRKPAPALRNGAASPMVARGKKGTVDADGKTNGGGNRGKRGAGGVRAA